MEEGKHNAKAQTISCLKDSKMISKGFLYDILWIKELDSEDPPLEFFPVVKDFQKFS